MFQFRRFPAYTYLIQCTLREYCSRGFPHSEICGSQDMCSSPQLIAACHVLLRLLMPRHSPCALSSLTYRSLRSGSQELCRPQIRFIVVCVTLLKVHNKTLLPLLLLARNSHCFAVQFSRCRLPTSHKVRLKCSDLCLNTSI